MNTVAAPPPLRSHVLRWSVSAALVLTLQASLLRSLQNEIAVDVTPPPGPPEPFQIDLTPAPVSLPTLVPVDQPAPLPAQAAAPLPDATPPVAPPPTPAPPTPALTEPAPLPPVEPPVAVPPPAKAVAMAIPRPPPAHPTRRPARVAPVTPETSPTSANSSPPLAPNAPAPPPSASPQAADIAASWQSQVLVHLARFKRFPMQAQLRGEQGVVMMRFTVDRAGHVLSSTMLKSSGYADLNAEAEAWIKRAEPMPPFPPELIRTQVDLQVPLRFTLR
jgi:protein TonB